VLKDVSSVGIKLNNDYCGQCSICHSLCPYEAISTDSKTGEVKIDIEKCQFCGICYSACPASAIDIAYYDGETLAKQMQQLAKEKGSDTLVLMCRGNSPSTCEVEGILQDQSLSAANYVPVRVPCVGRITTEFVMKTLTSGIDRIIAVQCEEDFCRYKRGSRINTRRQLLTKKVLKQLGYRDDALTIVKYARKAVYSTEKCVGCDKCVFVCPYEAIEAEALSTPKIDMDKCVGCGACALVCPHLAIQLAGFEYENLSNIVRRYGKAAQQLKTAGVAPTILVFCCQWSEFSVLDQSEAKLFDNKAVVMEIPCFKGLDPVLVVEALQSGFDGVLASVCSSDDCKLELGRDVAERNAALLQRTLGKFGLHDRFEVYTGSPRSVGGFNEKLEAFIQKIATLPPISQTAPTAAVKKGDA
jgi:coenzyme F420-reducing hydrogenase delta subunit